MCNIFGDYVISNVCGELLSVCQFLCVSYFSCHVNLSFFFFFCYVVVLISNMCIVNNCNKVPHKKSKKTLQF
jgi:hypothetical protein